MLARIKFQPKYHATCTICLWYIRLIIAIKNVFFLQCFCKQLYEIGLVLKILFKLQNIYKNIMAQLALGKSSYRKPLRVSFLTDLNMTPSALL